MGLVTGSLIADAQNLYSQCKLHILVPTQSYKIQADMDCLEPQDKKALQDAIEENYKTEAD